jgi:glycosyltransferase involved in cell wall biosynthesis
MMGKLRILFLGNTAPYRIGGAEVQARLLTECFARRRHWVTVAGYAVPHGRLAAPHQHGSEIEMRHLSTLRFNKLARGASFSASLIRFLIRRKSDFDVIFCSTFNDAALVVALLKRFGFVDLPLVIRCEGHGQSGDAAFLRALPATRWLVCLLRKECNAVNVISPRIEAELKTLGMDPAVFTRIPNGVTIPRAEKQTPYTVSGPRAILFAGRMVPQKGVPDLLRAAKVLKNQGLEFRINLVGQGPLYRRMQQLARALVIDDVVTFHGWVHPQQMANYYRTNHFLVLPSRQEAFGMAVAEAMSYGLPVVVTTAGGPEYYVDHRVGRVCPVGDVDALAAALKEMIRMPLDALQTMGKAARILVNQHFNIENTADQFLDLFYQQYGPRTSGERIIRWRKLKKNHR